MRFVIWLQNHPAIVLLGIAGSVVSIFQVCYPRKPLETIIVGRIVDGAEFATWLADTFATLHPGYTVVYDPPINSDEENSSDRFTRLMDEGRASVLLGGSVVLHERYSDDLAALRGIPREQGSPVDPMRQRWIGWYQKFLGICWDKRTMPTGWVPRSVRDIDSFPNPRGVVVPRPGTSASFDFLQALSDKDDPTRGEHEYARYLRDYACFESRQPSSEHHVARGYLGCSICWPHDAVTAREVGRYSCLGVAIPDDMPLSLSCISVRNGRRNPAVDAFVRLALSPEVQWQHFVLENRWPADSAMFRRALQHVTVRRPFEYFDARRPRSTLRYEGGWMDSVMARLEPQAHQVRLPLTRDSVSAFEGRGCSTRPFPVRRLDLLN